MGNDATSVEEPLAYVGESESVGGRLADHIRKMKSNDTKAFWTDTVVLISKDQNLTKSHARYVEACLIRDALASPRWRLPNAQTPSTDAGRLPLPERVAMDEFVDQTKTLTGALGWDIFRVVDFTQSSTAETRVGGSEQFFFSGEGYDARMALSPAGECVLIKGSKVRIYERPSFPETSKQLRNSLLEKGILAEQQGAYVLQENYAFKSVSGAAGFVVGGTANGRKSWKTDEGLFYDDWEKAQAGPE